MAKRKMEAPVPPFDEFLNAAQEQIPTTSEPRNGGASLATFFQALGKIDEDYEPHIVVTFPKSLADAD